jgi:hypothetical protein
MNTLDTRGLGKITGPNTRDGINRDYGSFASYAIGRVLVAGGWRHHRRRQNPCPNQDSENC